MSDGSPFGFVQKQFEEEIQKVERAAQQTKRNATIRRYVAYVLRAFAVFGGIAIASGINPQHAQIVGIVIAVAVAIDSISSNHQRLVALTEAQGSYESSATSVQRLHTIELIPILQAKQTDPAKAEAAATALLQRLLRMLFEEEEKVEAALRAADQQALRKIAVDQAVTVALAEKKT